MTFLTETRSRMAQISTAFLAAGVIAWVADRYGPSPEPNNALKAPISSIRSGEGDGPGESANPLYMVDYVLSLLGSSQAIVGEGCVSAGVSAFFDDLEAQYRRKGFARSGPAALEGKRFYWRTQLTGFEIFGVRSLDPPETLMTFVSAAPCGTAWKTYSYATARRPAAARALRADVAETDPPAPPGVYPVFKMAGLYGSEVCAYSIHMQADRVAGWYRDAMSDKKWNRESTKPAHAGLLRDAMFFTRGERYCLIWIADRNGSGRTTVLVSVGRSTI